MESTRNEFINTIEKQYKEFCKLNQTMPSIEGFAAYLVNRNLIEDKTINRFIIVDKYPSILKKNLGIARIARWELEDHVPLKETSIKTILQEYSCRFRHKERLNRKT